VAVPDQQLGSQRIPGAEVCAAGQDRVQELVVLRIESKGGKLPIGAGIHRLPSASRTAAEARPAARLGTGCGCLERNPALRTLRSRCSGGASPRGSVRRGDAGLGDIQLPTRMNLRDETAGSLQDQRVSSVGDRPVQQEEPRILVVSSLLSRQPPRDPAGVRPAAAVTRRCPGGGRRGSSAHHGRMIAWRSAGSGRWRTGEAQTI